MHPCRKNEDPFLLFQAYSARQERNTRVIWFNWLSTSQRWSEERSDTTEGLTENFLDDSESNRLVWSDGCAGELSEFLIDWRGTSPVTVNSLHHWAMFAPNSSQRTGSRDRYSSVVVQLARRTLIRSGGLEFLGNTDKPQNDSLFFSRGRAVRRDIFADALIGAIFFLFISSCKCLLYNLQATVELQEYHEGENRTADKGWEQSLCNLMRQGGDEHS